MLDWIIHKLNGYTHSEYKELYNKYIKLLNENADMRTIQFCNEVTKHNLTELEKVMRNNYYSDWRNDLYNIVHNNLMHLIIHYLGDSTKHIIYKINPSLTSKEKFLEEYKKTFN